LTDSVRPESRAERTGRLVALGVFAVLVCGITLVWTSQVVRQTFFPEGAAVAPACRESLRGLIGAVRRARSAADAAGGGERAALGRFRAALAPEWDARKAAGAACAGDAFGARALAEIDRLRFAEERAARYEADALARHRRSVSALERELSPP
jgi:hypothetical protein